MVTPTHLSFHLPSKSCRATDERTPQHQNGVMVTTKNESHRHFVLPHTLFISSSLYYELLVALSRDRVGFGAYLHGPMHLGISRDP
jgi:hypothetical protein